MIDLLLSDALSWTLVIFFGGAGVATLLGPRTFLETYFSWNYRIQDHFKIGALELLTAMLIAYPPLRVWGIALAMLLTFGGIVMLLCRRRYRFGLGGVAILIALSVIQLA